MEDDDAPIIKSLDEILKELQRNTLETISNDFIAHLSMCPQSESPYILGYKQALNFAIEYIEKNKKVIV
jgi:hypothetical protein